MTPTKRLARPRPAPLQVPTPAEIDRFYTAVLTASEKEAYPVARRMEGLDHEIATLRVKIRTAASDEKTLALMLRGIEVLARLLGKRYGLSSASVAELAEEMRASLDDVVPAPAAADNRAGHD